MKIIFDHQIFANQSFGGISRYFVRLAQGLINLGEQVDVVAPLHCNRYLRDLPSTSVHGVELSRFPPKTGRLAELVNYYLSKHKATRLCSDVLHETYYSERPVYGSYKGSVITVYDMIHEKYADNFPVHDITSKKKRLAIARADHIVSISHSTKNDLCALFDVPEHKVSVVHLGFEKFASSDVGFPSSAKTVRPFLLYVGLRGGYKNFSAMLKAVASNTHLKNSLDVVAFGGGAFNSKEQALITELGFCQGAVRQVGGDDEVLGRLYSEARALVYPSIYEGFGLPPLEAMAHSCPVVSSNSSSMPEVIGPAGAYFDPLDIEDQAQAIASVVLDEQRRTTLIESGRARLPMFSWDICASETQAVYHKVLEAKWHR